MPRRVKTSSRRKTKAGFWHKLWAFNLSAGKQVAAGIPRPTAEEAKQWATNFDALLSHEYGILMFKDFLKSQHCSENLNFWLDVEKYKQANGDLRDSEAKRIYESYISIMSPTEFECFNASLSFKTCEKKTSIDLDQHRFKNTEYSRNEHGASFNDDVPTCTRTNILLNEERLFSEVFKMQAVQAAAMPLMQVLLKYLRQENLYKSR